MASHPECMIRFYERSSLSLLGSTAHPRKITIKSGFGAQKRRCWLEFYNEDSDIQAELGTMLEVRIDDTACFRGRILQRRIDCVDDYLSVYAEWDPEREYPIDVGQTFLNRSIRTMLDRLLLGSGIVRATPMNYQGVFSRMEFFNEPIFAAIDLLAKLAGNWLWDIKDDSTLLFRAPSDIPDHVLHLDKTSDTINLWETNGDLYSEIEIQGGITNGSTYDTWITIPELSGLSNTGSTRIYTRPIASLDAFSALKNAIISQMTRPHYEHYADLAGRGETIAPGATVRLTADDFPLLPDDLIFRVKIREIVFAHESLNVRLHLTSGLESSPTYFHYHRTERVDPPSYLEGKVGSFQLDISALDSATNIDEK